MKTSLENKFHLIAAIKMNIIWNDIITDNLQTNLIINKFEPELIKNKRYLIIVI